MSDELKPCPFCHSDRLCVETRVDEGQTTITYYEILCITCGARGPEVNDWDRPKEIAVPLACKKWNIRSYEK